ncbi:MAG: uracil-DNA glycosylase [Bacillales bacterium]|jgi:uracil-DNA glycosylase|nr:uracil-DNA glycosylase [Bacillales bacterium]
MNYPKNDWKQLFEREYQKDYFNKLITTIDQQYKQFTVYPSKDNIFKALKNTTLYDVKVVILGQDPYHNANQANGLSFSVNINEKIPPSLRNILKEVKEDIGNTILQNGDLEQWSNQGVLLLNTVLTVREGEPKSHRKIGWELFTDEIIREVNNKKQPVVFMLWGRHAAQKEALITNGNHLILKAAHPSPLSANRGFFGCRHFSICNKFLEENELMKINW